MTVAIKKVEAELLGRDQVSVEFKIENLGTSEPRLVDLDISSTGCLMFQERLVKFRQEILKLSASDRTLLLLPKLVERRASKGLEDFYRGMDGRDHVSILLRELILKLQDRFQLPYQDVELCHCRAVPTVVVDRAIVGGCHSTQAVARTTSAGTSCGTCKPDTERLIAYRLASLSNSAES